ncbi:MAG: hypothetical protein GXP08_06635 [Gammaproteobacteria bacterium]|nr:hypothetical protein [Gammaproteobacteria bacterium]
MKNIATRRDLPLNNDIFYRLLAPAGTLNVSHKHLPHGTHKHDQLSVFQCQEEVCGITQTKYDKISQVQMH